MFIGPEKIISTSIFRKPITGNTKLHVGNNRKSIPVGQLIRTSDCKNFCRESAGVCDHLKKGGIIYGENGCTGSHLKETMVGSSDKFPQTHKNSHKTTQPIKPMLVLQYSRHNKHDTGSLNIFCKMVVELSPELSH